ncbi:MAG: HNH endonuclease [Pseudomonas sp.]|nr:HNH endonuclease [Pseudomonas sp.]
MNIGFQRIFPTPTYPAGMTIAALSAYSWTSTAVIVTRFKDSVKQSLREVQLGRCCFCRRRLGDNGDTDLEHFVDKGAFKEFSFEVRNLALSCGICNAKKNGSFSSWRAKMAHRPPGFVGPRLRNCPVLNVTIHAGDAFPISPDNFRWVNPHLHNYSDHIAVERSWVFRGITPTGRRTVRGLKLNDLGDMERRALYETLEMRGGRISMLFFAAAQLEHHRASDVLTAVAKALTRRRRATAVVP